MGIKFVLSDVFKRLSEKKGVLARSLIIPVLVYLSLQGFIYLQMQVTLQGMETSPSAKVNIPQNSTYIFIVGLFGYLLCIIMAVIIHRVILLEEPSISKWGITWTMRETKFLLYGILIGLLSMVFFLPMILFAAIPWAGLIIGVCMIFLVLPRFSLVFPTIAVEHDVSFQLSWDLTKKHKFLMAFIVVILPMLFSILILPIQIFANQEGLLFNILYSHLIWAGSAILTISALSITYKHIIIENDKNNLTSPAESI